MSIYKCKSSDIQDLSSTMPPSKFKAIPSWIGIHGQFLSFTSKTCVVMLARQCLLATVCKSVIMAKVGALLRTLLNKNCYGNTRLHFFQFIRTFGKDSQTDATIQELNQELEYVFGQSPDAFNSGSAIHGSSEMEEGLRVNQFKEKVPALSHVDAHGKANMVDVSEKPGTKRVAIASCKVLLGENAFRLVASNQIAKGDVLNVAKIAGIYGAKQTGNLIPLCHNIMLSNVRMNLTLNKQEHAVDIEGEVTSVGQTGVEMEAMTAVSVAGLTIYDMCKAVSKGIQITNVRLESKTGGKSGIWARNR